MFALELLVRTRLGGLVPQAKLTLTIPETTWIRDVSTTYPDLVFRVQTVLVGEETGIGLVELYTENPLPVVTEIRSRDDIVDVELLWKYEDEAILQVETVSPLLLIPVWRAGVPLQMPFDIQDGEAMWELTTSSRRLSNLGDHLDDFGISFTLEHVREIYEGEADRILTSRQQELVLAALKAGYYSSPRETTLTDVADENNISKSTLSDVLHRAESNIIQWFVEEHFIGNVFPQ